MYMAMTKIYHRSLDQQFRHYSQSDQATPESTQTAIKILLRRCPSLQLLALVCVGIAQPAMATPFQEAKVVEINGNQLFINNKRATLKQVAHRGSVIHTIQSSAKLHFDRRAIGLLGPNSMIKLGAACFQLDQGKVVVNGRQKGCFGSQILGIDGTTYLLSREVDQSYTVDLLAGEAVISRAPASIDDAEFAQELPPQDGKPRGAEPDILTTYPRIAPWLGASAGGFGSAYPSGGGAFSGGLSYFQPIAQTGAKQVLYSSASLGSSFQDVWGFSTEIGYRWLTPSIQSTNSVYLGYAGYSAPGCYTNMLNGGAQWEQARWRLGASGGLKMNDCTSSFNFAALNLSIPVGRISSRTVYFSISPYLLNGNIVSADLLQTDSNPDSFPGVRLSLEIPFTPWFSLKGYGGADSVFGVTAGGQFSIKIPTAGRILKDPNIPPGLGSDAKAEVMPASMSGPASTLLSRNVSQALLAMANKVVSPASDQTAGLLASADGKLAQQSGTTITIKQGQRGRFSPQGDLLSIDPISNRDFVQLILTNFRGFAPLPESHRIAKIAEQRGVLKTRLSGVLGTDFLANASQPISVTTDTPFSPLTQMPAGRFVCAATQKARELGAEEAKKGQFDYSGGPAYFGKGSATSQGYPATYNKADAFVFADAGICRELNRLAGQGYDVVEAEPI
jgi:hypothetical protein